MLTATVIFLITYLFIGLRQIPRVHIDRPAGALVGAVLMVVTGVLTLDEAFAAVDLHTLLLLFGMMVITVYLRIAGFFELMAGRIITHSRTPLQLLTLVSLSSAVLSALFVNDTICLLFTPIVLEVALQLRVNPMPYLLALATSSNIGSVMTITGNPQNMLIGIYSRVPYLPFFAALVPVAAIVLVVSIAVIRLIYRGDLAKTRFDHQPTVPAPVVDRRLLILSLLVCAGVLVAFSAGFPYSLSAAAGGVALMLLGGVRTERVLEGVDWTLLLFFAGLFIVMRGVEASGLAGKIIAWAGDLSGVPPLARIAGLSVLSAALSNVVSNVPAVMLLKSFIESLGGERVLWLTLAMSSTLAGNLTLIGSVANLIVAQQARKRVEIGFLEYLRVGALVTVITIGAGILVLAAEIRLAEAAADRPAISVMPAKAGAAARSFSVVLLRETDEEKAQGLQGFRRLRENEAALFFFRPPQQVTFWMASVSYPIDIVFVDQQGMVIGVADHCRPGGAEIYPSGGPVGWVIETAAGSGLAPGDRISFTGLPSPR